MVKPPVPKAGSAPSPIGTALENRMVKTVEPVQLQTGRYSYIPAKPLAEQVNPLLVVIDVRVPPDFTTVEDVAGYLLTRSGYRLAAASAQGLKVRQMLHQSIPEVQRHLGPMTLQDALLTLGGPAFRLLVDPVHRLVAYDLSPQYRTAGDFLDAP